MRRAGRDRHGLRIRALVAVCGVAGCGSPKRRRSNETDLDERRGSILIRRGKGDKRREAGMDQCGCEHFNYWLAHRISCSVGPLFLCRGGPTRGRRWSDTSARAELRQLATVAGVRRRFAPHQLRHAHAVEMASGGAVNVIQRQLGHADLGATSTYLQGIDTAEIIDTVHARRPPTIPASAGLTTLIPPRSTLQALSTTGRWTERRHCCFPVRQAQPAVAPQPLPGRRCGSLSRGR